MPLEFLKCAKTAVVRRPPLISQMSQTNYKIENQFQMFCGNQVLAQTPDSCDNCFCICILFFCSWLPGSCFFLEGAKPPSILGSESAKCMLTMMQG